MSLHSPSTVEEKYLMLKVSPSLYTWIENRAAKNRRARLREAVDILERERDREERRNARARGGAR